MEPASASPVESSLQSIWGHVLNLPHVALDQPFLSVGGDSISAMQVVGQCRKEGMSVGVQDVLRSRSITQLATTVKELENSSYDDQEYFDEEFDLTPIQYLYFQRPHTKGHFNQSFYLRVTRKTTASKFQAAVEQLIARHSMLRARFSFSTEHGWQQRLTSESALRHPECFSASRLAPLVLPSSRSPVAYSIHRRYCELLSLSL
jgi:aryl carrier-like protein